MTVCRNFSEKNVVKFDLLSTDDKRIEWVNELYKLSVVGEVNLFQPLMWKLAHKPRFSVIISAEMTHLSLKFKHKIMFLLVDL